jgi:hypothetical protein
MIVHRMGDQNDVADVLGVGWYLELKRVLYCEYRCDRVDRGADTAEALGENTPLARIAPAQDCFKPALHGTACPSLFHRTCIDLNINAHIPFNASDWVYYDTSDGVPPFGLPASFCHGERHFMGHAMRPMGRKM